MNIYPATYYNLSHLKPMPPPDFYEKETIEGKEFPKNIPEGYFGVGVSPFIQAIYKKVSQFAGLTFGDIYRALTSEFRIMKKSKESETMLKKLLNWCDKHAGYVVLSKQKLWIAGTPPPVDIPLIKYTPGMDPIKEQICDFCRNKQLATYEEIAHYITKTLAWLTDTGYLNRCIRELIKEKCIVKIGGNIYEYEKHPELF